MLLLVLSFCTCKKEFDLARWSQGSKDLVAMVPEIFPETSSVQQESAASGEEAAAKGTGIGQASSSSATAMVPSLQRDSVVFAERAAGGEGVDIDVVPSAEGAAAEGAVTHEASTSPPIAQPLVQQVRGLVCVKQLACRLLLLLLLLSSRPKPSRSLYPQTLRTCPTLDAANFQQEKYSKIDPYGFGLNA